MNNLRISLILLTYLIQFSLFGNAHAAMLNVLHDRFDLDVYTIWGENAYEPESLTEPLGTVDSESISGSLLSDVSSVYGVGSMSNMAYANSTITSYIGAENFTVNLRVNLDDDIPGSRAGHGHARNAWNFVFDVVGDGGSISQFGNGNNTIFDYDNFTLFDVTSGALYQESLFETPLIDGHMYVLSAEIVQTIMGRDESSEMDIRFRNVALNVPEPSTLTLLLAGLAALGFRRNLKS